MAKILVLNYEFPPVGGGGGRVCQEICSGLAARGHNIHLHTTWFKGLLKTETDSGYTIHRSFTFRRYADRCRVWEMALYIICSVIPVLLLVRRFKPQVIHAHFAVPTGVLAWIVSLCTGIPYVLTAHLGDVPGGVPEQTDGLFKKLNFVIRLIWKRAKGVTAVSGFVATLAKKAYQVPVHIIHNGLNFSGLPAQSAPVASPVRLLFVGRFNPQKNLPFLVHILKDIRSTNWEAHFVGEGPDFTQVKGLIEKFSLKNKITLHGWQNPQDIKKMMASSDVLLIPSLSEGLPMVGVESLGYGLCIFGSNIDGLTDVLEDGVNGVACPLGNLSLFAQKLDELLDVQNGKLMSMKKASLLKRDLFSMSHIIDAYEKALGV
ncbi:glycosyltransferase family 4 protein [bacterium]|nr:glycosyltransferase family 4 protein [bacterium]